jgi:hypothetical protein
MYNKNLPTYKKVLADYRSKSLEPRSHLLAVACMSWVKSTRLLHKDPPRMGKLVPIFSRLDLSQYEITYLKAM